MRPFLKWAPYLYLHGLEAMPEPDIAMQAGGGEAKARAVAWLRMCRRTCRRGFRLGRSRSASPGRAGRSARPGVGLGSSVVEFVDGHLRRSENMSERARRNGALTMHRNDRKALGIVSVPDEHMAAALPHAHEPEALQFLQKLSRRQTGQRRHDVN